MRSCTGFLLAWSIERFMVLIVCSSTPQAVSQCVRMCACMHTCNLGKTLLLLLLLLLLPPVFLPSLLAVPPADPLSLKSLVPKVEGALPNGLRCRLRRRPTSVD